MNEIALIEAAQQGNVDAFQILVTTYQHLLYNVAYRILGDGDAADDATQQAFIAAYRNLYRFRGAGFKSWLLRILTNACYDELRRWKSRPSTSLEALGADHSDDDSSWLVDPGEGPEAYVQRRELSQKIQQGLDTLPAEQRIILVLCDIHGLSYEEAAEATNTQVGTVKSRLSRARGKMREYLQRTPEPVQRPCRLVAVAGMA